MNNGFDSKELEDLTWRYRKVADQLTKESKIFLRKEGTKLKRATKKQVKTSGVGRLTGHYEKSINRGKVYKYHGAQAIRVYATARHAHLIEEGHRMVMSDGREVGFVPGYHVFENARKGFEPKLVDDTKKWVEKEVKPLER